ncbi:uncharacterized protein LOC116591709 [Mustela erminea]|uniref:uncharacterized protein LOC116591709 n=1 Tax=Mustela erminea TaxID=36723 RepID=UPI0013867E45|nr:uncharacterized protein LOC116591709 [Mustela erminea]
MMLEQRDPEAHSTPTQGGQQVMASGRRDANDSGSTWRPFRKKLQCSLCHINQRNTSRAVAWRQLSSQYLPCMLITTPPGGAGTAYLVLMIQLETFALHPQEEGALFQPNPCCHTENSAIAMNLEKHPLLFYHSCPRSPGLLTG